MKKQYDYVAVADGIGIVRIEYGINDCFFMVYYCRCR